MPKFKINVSNIFFSLLCVWLMFLTKLKASCPFPYERCICTGATPYCPCLYLTSTQSLNFTSSYISHLISVNNYGCRPCPPTCKKCSSLQICTDCFDEFELIGSSCIACPINCQKCKSGVCQSCIDQYYIDYQKKCQKCPLQGTKSCTIDSLRSCESNYWLDNNGAECVNCDINCKICSSTTKCTTCIDGFYENQFKCNACKTQCKTCKNNVTCLQCKLNGYYFNTTQGMCIQCPSNCLSCSSSSVVNNGSCLLCDYSSGYFLDKNSGKCLSYSNYSILNSVIFQQSCQNVTLNNASSITINSNYICQYCQQGYYLLNQYNNASTSKCYYGCSILCKKCTGPHYGQCDQCVNSDSFDIINRNCIPQYNLNEGSTYQYYYTAFNNNSFFNASSLILPNSCWHQYVKGGSDKITIKLSNLKAYKVKLKWKIYKYNFNNSTYSNGNQSYGLSWTNSKIQSQNLTFGYSFLTAVCQDRAAFSSLCLDGSIKQCIDKNQQQFQSFISASSNTIQFSSSNSFLAISQLLVIAYRCGGIYGDGCSQCTDINTCTKCQNPNYYLIAEKCITQCPNSHYTYEQKKSCNQICPSQSYSDDSLHQCFSCVTPCQTCSSSTQCITCKEGFFYNQITNQCQIDCPKTYYKDYYRRICQKCANPCLDCLDNVVCYSCKYGFLNITSSTSASSQGSCMLQCPEGQYADLQTLQCKQCKSPCLTCSSFEDSCTSCLVSYFLLNTECLLNCPAGYFKYDLIFQCWPCSSECKQCLNLTYCSSCEVGYYLNASNVCASSCIDGYYSQNIALQCLKCNETCRTCKSDKLCSSCITGYYFSEENYQCYIACDEFYYKNIQDPSHYVCSRCQLPCYSCTSKLTCLSCYDSFLYNGQCSLNCSSGYYPDVTSLKCQPCDTNSCVQCKNSPAQCTQCKTNLLLVNGKCLVQCPDGFYFSQYKKQCILCQGICNTCINSSFCLSCISGLILLNSTGECISACDNGFYKIKSNISNQFICLECPQNCQSCQFDFTVNQLHCVECILGYYLHSGQCSLDCLDGFYRYSKICIACSSPCSKCQDDQYCLECISGHGFLYEGGCVASCPYGFYLNGSTCQICGENCLLCSQKINKCTACSTNYLLVMTFQNSSSSIQGTCKTTCPIGYYKFSDDQCQKCSTNCESCKDSFDSCSTCSSSLLLYMQRCVQSCPIQFYVNTTSKSCQTCQLNCQYCLNQNYCVQCSQNFFLRKDNLCYLNCASDQYPENGACKKCAYPCSSCISENQCLSCLIGIYYDKQCIQQCLEGSYFLKNQSESLCIDCPVNCSRCLSETECLFCLTGFLLNGLCQQNCSQGFYGNYGTCTICQQNCQSCENGHECLNCTQGSYLLTGKCLKNCPNGFVEGNLTSSIAVIQFICIACNLGCTKCFISFDNCIECSLNKYLYIDKCLSQCPSTSYPDQKEGVCQPCISPCQTCLNAYSCESCIYSYLLYRQNERNQCVEGPNCPNNYYLNVDDNVCQFVCPDEYYVSNTSKTCSKKCSTEYVTYEQSKSCLSFCPQNMWIDENRICQNNQTKPQNLPYLSCSSFVIRNLLFAHCYATVSLENMNDLQIGDFYSKIGIITILSIKNTRQLFLLMSNVNQNLKGQYITIQLTSPYKLMSNQQIISASSLKQPSIYAKNVNEINSKSYPLQNLKMEVFVQKYVSYSIQQRQVGINFYQIGQSISFAALVLWGFSLFKNIKATSLIFIINLQWLFTLNFLSADGSFSPNFNQFLQSFKYSALIAFDSMLNGQNEGELWYLNQLQKAQFWAINKYYNFSQSTFTIYLLIIIFLGVYLITFALHKLLQPKSAIQPLKTEQGKQNQQRIKQFKQNQQEDSQQNKLQANQTQFVPKKGKKTISKVFKKQPDTKSTELKIQTSKNKENNSKQQECQDQQQQAKYVPKKGNSKINIQKQKKIDQKFGLKSIQQASNKNQINDKKHLGDSYEEKQTQQPQIQLKVKISKKCQIIKQRFQFNYLYHLILISANGISICSNLQLIKPNYSSFIQTLIFITAYTVFIIVSFYFYYKAMKGDDLYRNKKPLRSTAFFFISFVEILIQNAVIIWTGFYFYIGFGIVTIILNIIAWSWIYQKQEPIRCTYLQSLQLLKMLVLIFLVIGQIKKQKWSTDEIYYFGFAQVAIVFLLILLSSVSIAKQLFSDETPFKTKQKTKTKSLKSSENNLKSIQQDSETSGFQNDDEDQEEQSFFSNKIVQSESDDSSDGDIIDFDQSANQSQKSSSDRSRSNNKSRNYKKEKVQPPRELFKYGKIQKNQ